MTATGYASPSVPANLIDAKGDLIVGSGPDTPVRMPVGVNGELLVADSTETTGIDWQTAAEAGVLSNANNLSDLANAATALSNLGIPSPTGLWAPLGRTPKPVTATIVSQLQSGHGWLGSSGFTANDTTDFIVGTQSAKLTTPGDGNTYKIEKTGLSLDTTGKQFRLRLKIDNIAFINTWRWLAGNDSAYTNSYTWSLADSGDGNTAYFVEGEWVTITLNFASATTTGSPTRTGITAIKLNTRDNNTAHAVTAHIQSVELIDEPSTIFSNGLVSISFDDNFDSVWTLAKPKLDAVGIRATLFLIDDLIDVAGRLTSSQIMTCQNQGWEVCAHSHTNADHTATFTGLTAAQVEADMRAQVAQLRTNGLRGSGTAYPQGAFGVTTDAIPTRTLAQRYFNYSRTTYRRTMETFPASDLMRLRAQSAITSFAGGYPAANLTTTTTGDLDRAKANHAWLHLVFHKIVTVTPTATTEILQSDFNAIIDKIVSAGITCIPIGEALTYYG
jgi:Polysaccharide deacetylase